MHGKYSTSSPSRFATNIHLGQSPALYSASLPGSNYVATSPSPLASGGSSSVLRDPHPPNSTQVLCFARSSVLAREVSSNPPYINYVSTRWWVCVWFLKFVYKYIIILQRFELQLYIAIVVIFMDNWYVG
jgi:hypothetical protein